MGRASSVASGHYPRQRPVDGVQAGSERRPADEAGCAGVWCHRCLSA